MKQGKSSGMKEFHGVVIKSIFQELLNMSKSSNVDELKQNEILEFFQGFHDYISYSCD
jgi:hypothetical protein